MASQSTHRSSFDDLGLHFPHYRGRNKELDKLFAKLDNGEKIDAGLFMHLLDRVDQEDERNAQRGIGLP